MLCVVTKFDIVRLLNLLSFLDVVASLYTLGILLVYPASVILRLFGVQWGASTSISLALPRSAGQRVRAMHRDFKSLEMKGGIRLRSKVVFHPW